MLDSKNSRAIVLITMTLCETLMETQIQVAQQRTTTAAIELKKEQLLFSSSLLSLSSSTLLCSIFPSTLHPMVRWVQPDFGMALNKALSGKRSRTCIGICCMLQGGRERDGRRIRGISKRYEEEEMVR